MKKRCKPYHKRCAMEWVRCLGYGSEHNFQRRIGDLAHRLCTKCRRKKDQLERSISLKEHRAIDDVLSRYYE